MQYSQKCAEKCQRETARLKDDLDVSLPSWLYWGDSHGQALENDRCMSFCNEYIAQCASKLMEARKDNVEVSTTELCTDAENKWKNYLFVVRNRPTKMNFPKSDQPKKVNNFIPDKAKSKEEIAQELQEKYRSVTGQTETAPPKAGYRSVEEYMMRRQ